MTRGEFMKSLSDVDLAVYLYFNSKHTRLGYKRLTAWVLEEVDEQIEINKLKEDK